MRDEFEKFPVEKRQIRLEDPPELIFFDVDEDEDEAEFIRVDDLFQLEQEDAPGLTGKISFTLFPRKGGEFIGSRFSRMIHRTLILSALRMQKRVEKIRVRPFFVQWQIELTAEDEPEILAKEFRADLEFQTDNLRNLNEEERFWADSCFVRPADKEIADDKINRMVALYQEE